MKLSYWLFFILAAIRLAAQNNALAGNPEFDAASLKAVGVADHGRSNVMGGPGTADPGRVSYLRVTLAELIATAYGVADDQVAGPDAVLSDRYTLLATLPAGSTQEQFQFMLQRLLSERLALKIHHETRDYDGYQLAVSKKGIKTKNLKPTAEKGDEQNSPPHPDPSDGVVIAKQPLPIDRDGCPIVPAGGTQVGGKWGSESCSRFQAISMAEFCKTLRALIQMTEGIYGNKLRLVDRTGLAGRYDFTLVATIVPFGFKNTNASGPTIEMALEQQLGLKLDRVKESLDTIVVDHSDRIPAAN